MNPYRVISRLSAQLSVLSDRLVQLQGLFDKLASVLLVMRQLAAPVSGGCYVRGGPQWWLYRLYIVCVVFVSGLFWSPHPVNPADPVGWVISCRFCLLPPTQPVTSCLTPAGQ